ncbi:uncharacterized protein LOC125749250 [Brienomyrus brachyistius]|uniref:uncharacterized protein LOC125749250 n=1 Tax=Brienomyrus brachyistius TaxID=42636 RepID=UPI0020B2C8DC|nr:uncharacterized protein LOC125749250 [Brienomyrus brachyistius]
MYHSKTPISLAILAVLAAVVYASTSGGGGPYKYDISTQSGLTELYNKPVFLAEKMKRPLDPFSVKMGWLSHSGVRVTLGDDSQWLIHKGNDFGIDSQTVVVSDRHMSDNWEVVEWKNFYGTKKVGDFVKASGVGYNWIFNNCHIGANRMIKQ